MTAWKQTNDDLLPYHPQASHIDPAYRDGWNAAHAAHVRDADYRVVLGGRTDTALLDLLALVHGDDGRATNTLGLLRSVARARQKIAEAAADTARLDLMLRQDAFKHVSRTDAGGLAYQIWKQDEDEDYHVVSGPQAFFPTPRAALDAALALEVPTDGT